MLMKRILFLLSILLFSKEYHGQSPGGVSANLQLWYKADSGVTTSGTEVTQWNNSAPPSHNLVQQGGSGTLPLYNSGLINFNPSIRFDGENDRLYSPGVPQNITTSASSPYTTSQYIVYRKLEGVNAPIYSHSNGSGGTWNIGANTDGRMLITNRFVNTSASGANEVRLQALDGSSSGATSYLNGTSISSSFSGGVSASGQQSFWVGGQGTNNFSNTDISEIVIYNAPQSNRQQIESYLCLKYGISKSGNYIASDGTTNYWNATINSGYTSNIAGIGRDDNSGVYQKQSMSQSSGSQVLIGLNSISDMNSSNTGTLSNNQYLLWGDNGLGKYLHVPLSHIVNGIEINSRFASVWKVQNTGNVGTVRVMWPAGITNLHLVQSIDETITTADTFTAMTGTQTINGITYNYTDISLADGQYFTFAGYGYAPGGVLGLTHWYRADKGVGASGTTVSTWKDQVQGVVSSQISTAPVPYIAQGSASYFNFNPGINFTADDQKLGNISVQTLKNINFDIFTLTKEGMSGNRFLSIGFNNTTFSGINWDGPGMEIVDGRIRRRNNTGSSLHNVTSSSINFDSPIPSIMYNNFTDTSVSRGLNGALLSTLSNHSARGQMAGGHIFGANRGAGTGGDDYGFIGNIGEIIIYGAGNITAEERRKVDSYLAIKYGLTLDRVDTDHYLSSNSSIIWNGSTNSDYNNNIAGIARDEFSLLYQKQSISVNPGQQILIGLPGMADTNVANTGTLTDGQFLIWGDNGLRKSLLEGINGIADVNFRFASVWKVQNTGNVGTVRVMWPQGITNPKLVQNVSDPTFTTGNIVTDMSVNTQIINGVTYNYADVELTNGQFFTIAGYATGPGGVVDPDFWVKSDDAGDIATAWKDHSSNADDIPATGTWSLSDADSAHNFYPFTTGYSSSKLFYNSSSKLNSQFNNGTSGPMSHSIFSAVRPTDNANGRITGIDDDVTYAAEPGISIISSGLPRHYEYTNSITSTNFGAAFNLNRSNVFSAIADNHVSAGGGSSYSGGEKRLGLNGNYELIGFNNSNRFQFDGMRLRIGHGTWNVSGAFPGDIMEVIWFKRALTTNEQSRVNTYLAIKNGVTLNEDYLSALNNIVWNRTISPSYNNSIFGIANDMASALHQKISTSINPSSILTVSKDNNFILSNLDSSRTGLPGDNRFLMFGDNNDNSTLPYTPPQIGECGEIIDLDEIKLIPKKWLVQRTGNIENVYLQANLSAYSSGININVFMLVADDENFTQNVVKIPGIQGTGGNWIFAHNFDNSQNNRYITFGGEFQGGVCETCKGQTYTLRTGNQWNTNATPWENQINNKKENILLGNDADGNPLTASLYADYTVNPGIEYIPNRYPRRYGGRWAISRRYDNTNEQVQHSIVLSKAMKASFQVSNINTYLNNKNNFEIIGYCGGVPVMPKITYAYNTSYHTFTIDGNKAIGTMSWRGFTPNVSTANVRFDRPVERIVIICSVERTNTRQTLRSVTYSDITLECEEVVEPTPDNVYVSHNFTQDTLSTCGGDTTMRIKVTNDNICDDKIINLTQTLPAGLNYVNGSFNDLDLPSGALSNATVNISGNTFSITGLKIPQGEYWMYVDIANPGVANTYPTQFNYQVTNGVDPSFNYQSSVVNLTYYQASPLPPSPILTQTIKEVTSGNVTCGKNGLQITYRMKIENVHTAPIIGAEIMQAFDYDQTIVAVHYVDNENQDGVITGEYPVDGNGTTIQPIGSALFSLYNATIPVGVSYIDITVNVGNSYDIPEVQNLGLSAAFQILIDPTGECAESTSSSSNQTILTWCGPHCVKPGATGTPLISTIGISTKNNANVNGWPAVVPNGYLVLDAVNKGFVITHMTTEQINALIPVKGMIVYDTTEGRVKIYRGNNTDNKPAVDEERYGWQPITRSCNEE